MVTFPCELQPWIAPSPISVMEPGKVMLANELQPLQCGSVGDGHACHKATVNESLYSNLSFSIGFTRQGHAPRDGRKWPTKCRKPLYFTWSQGSEGRHDHFGKSAAPTKVVVTTRGSWEPTGIQRLRKNRVNDELTSPGQPCSKDPPCNIQPLRDVEQWGSASSDKRGHDL